MQHGALPGKYLLARLDGACGSGPPRPAGPLPGRDELAFYSRYRHRSVTMVTLVPAARRAGGKLGVVMGLHGAGANARTMAGQLGPAMAAARIAGFAAVTVDGGDTYWHRRADGDDPVGMIVYEVLPLLAAAGLLTSQIGIAGESMGGYGALLLAERLSAGSQPAGAAATAGSSTPGNQNTRAEPVPAPAAVAALSPAVFGS
jgi:hypothetical protein